MKASDELSDIGSILSRFPTRTKDEEVEFGETGHRQSPANRIAENDDEKENAQAKDQKRTLMFEPRLPRYRFKDLVLPKKVFDELAVLESMLKNHSLVYESWGMNEIDPYGKQVAFNLFGPPGTGKTMIVEALAERWNKVLIDVNMAQLESKYVGDTGKNIEAAFAAARTCDALLLFDEADAVLGRRLSEVKQSADSSVNTARSVMLKQLEQHTGIVAFATNFAHNYDNAFVRRILKHIQIDLPDGNGRMELFKRKVPVLVPGRESIEWQVLVDASEGFAGGDILSTVKNALFDAARHSDARLSTDMVVSAIKEWRTAKENIGQWNLSTVECIKKTEYEKAEDASVLVSEEAND